MWVVVIWNNRDAIIELEAEWIDRVIDEYQIFEKSVANDSEILYEDTFFSFEAVLSIKSELN